MSSELALNTLMAQGGRWRRYPAYRESGVEWIGEVPEEWEINKLNRIAEIKGRIGWRGYTVSDLRDKDDGVLVIGATQIDVNGNIDLSKPTYLSHEKYEESPEIKLKGFELLLVKVGATIGKVGYVPYNFEKATINPNVMIVRNSNLSQKFLFYFLRSPYVQIEMEVSKSAGAQDAINQDFVGSLMIAYPSSPEQCTIADFLDRKTGRIDTLIEKKGRQVELLQEKRAALISHAVTKGLDPDVKMKDSGVEWLGEIPEGWKLRKLKHVAKINLSNVDKKTKEDEDSVKLCNYVDVYKNDYINSDINFMEATASPNQIDKFALREGDVLITKDSESWEDIAVPAYIPTDLEDVICGYHLAHIRPDHVVVNGEYIFRSFSAICLNYQFKVEANGITRFGIGKYPIDNSLFLVPPINEQKSIAAFLDRETAHIDILTTKIRKSISKLREYRTALISAAVTGKIDVREGV